MDTPRETDSPDNLSALAWVHEELRKSLETAHKALRQFLKASEAVAGSDVDAVDPAVLRTARLQIHQSVGALELVGLAAGASVLRASEAAIQRFVAKPHSIQPSAVEAIEKASFALLDYIARLMGGKTVSPVALFPQYEAVQMVAGAERIHPADLWSNDWQWKDVSASGSTEPAREVDAQSLGEFEQLLLAMMRQPTPEVSGRLAQLCGGLAAGAPTPPLRTLWNLGSAFFEAQAGGALTPDLYTKRSASKLFAQLRSQSRGAQEAAQRLAQDLLFFVSQAQQGNASMHMPHLQAVRQAYHLDVSSRVDYKSATLGRHDPAWVAVARKRVATAKDAWSAVAAGEMHRLTGLAEQFSLVGESIQRLYPRGERLAAALHAAIAQTVSQGKTPEPALAMEVATSVLYLEASLEDGEFDHPEEAQRVLRLAQRLEAVRGGAAPQPLDSWMEELYRRVSDRQTMGSVVNELAANLGEAEKLIDQFFRKTDDRNVLIPVPAQLQAMRGVLSVLGLDQASTAVLRMRDDIDALLLPDANIQDASDRGVFDRLATNLGALGFLIDMLNVQPHLAKSLFRFDSATGVLSPLMGRHQETAPAAALPDAPRLMEQAQSVVEAAKKDASLEDLSRDLELLSLDEVVTQQPGLAATIEAAKAAVESAEQAGAGPATEHLAREQVVQAMDDFMVSVSAPMGLDVLPEAQSDKIHTRPGPLTMPGALTPLSAPAPQEVETGLEEDDEMRDIFLEEAREVIVNANEALLRLKSAPADVGDITALRRAFHTLKGSSRMVGLNEFGEAAWACEQLYNTWLAEQKPADEHLLGLSTEALQSFSAWADEIAGRRADNRRGPPIIQAADALRLEGKRVPRLPLVDNADATSGLSSSAAIHGTEGSVPQSVLDGAQDTGTAQAAVPALNLIEPLAHDAGHDAQPRHDEAAAPEIQAEFDSVRSAFDAFDSVRGELDDTPPATPVVESAAEMPAASDAAFDDEQDQTKVIGDLRISIPLFNIYLNEADEHSRRLSTELAEWAHGYAQHAAMPTITDTVVALAHSLAGSSATVGYADLSQLARMLEHALIRTQDLGACDADDAQLFVEVADEIRRLLHQFAAGFLKAPAPALIDRLRFHELESVKRLEAQSRITDFVDTPFEAPMLDAPSADFAPEPMGGELLELNFPAPEPAGETPTAQAVAAETPSAQAPALQTPAIEAVPTAPPPEFAATDALGLGAVEVKPLLDAPTPHPESTQVISLTSQAPTRGATEFDAEIDATDVVDPELFPIFEEEARELLPQLSAQLRDWSDRPGDFNAATACMRTLHTLKGGARLAGAMRMGEMAHRMESAIEHLLTKDKIEADDIAPLLARDDALTIVFDALTHQDAQSYAAADQAALESAAAHTQPAALDALPTVPGGLESVQSYPVTEAEPEVPGASAETAATEAAPRVEAVPTPVRRELRQEPLVPLDWSRFAMSAPAEAAAQVAGRITPAAQAAVRVRSQLLDRLVNHAGEVMITRTRLASEVGQIKGSLTDLTENLERLRLQLRDIELQAETQMATRIEAARAASQQFDPLEFDRYTRFQELTRMMAESVNDVATVQRTLQRTLETTEDQLATQARLTRDMQDDLLRTRMVEFESLSDRLYRVVRMAAKETGKQVRLDIVGGSVEVDRGVLDRMTGAFEHLLRNCVTHGIESPEVRQSVGKDATGRITVTLHQEGNEVGVEFRDDGAGLNLARIREKALAMGLLDKDADATEAELANLIFMPGFSTAESVTELAGRGIGMDVVRAEINAMGGRVETATSAGVGTSFKLVLPLTTAVTRVVMLRCGALNVAVPTHLVEIVRRAKRDELDAAYASGQYHFGELTLPFFWLGALLQSSPRGLETGRTLPVVVIRSAQQRVALHVDEVLGNQEVVVKNLGPQLSRLPGLAGMTLLASGAVALIYNPVALATMYGESARAYTQAALQEAAAQEAASATGQAQVQEVVHAAPLILVVDDSLTVRRVTQRLLAREGYRVSLAKDGLDALERLAEELPTVVLSDIEMPRMDGFDLVRNIRADSRLRALPVIMITSRIAQKHRDYANELGVNHYLGKPYSEEELLGLISRYCQESAKVE